MSARRGPRIVLLGKQGSGKGTQGERLATQLRHAAPLHRARCSATPPRSASPPASRRRRTWTAASWSPTSSWSRSWRSASGTRARWSPASSSTASRARASRRSSSTASSAAHPLDIVIDLEVPSEVVVERMRPRGRDDDTEESIRRRLALYEPETKPLVDFYRDRSLLVTGRRPGQRGRGRRRASSTRSRAASRAP